MHVELNLNGSLTAHHEAMAMQSNVDQCHHVLVCDMTMPSVTLRGWISGKL